MEQFVFLLDISYILSRLELCPLCIHICVEDLRHELYEQHDADHSEGISDAVSDGCIRGTGSVKRCRKSRRTCKGSGHHTYRDIGRHACDLDDAHRCQRTDGDNDEAQQDIGFCIDLKVPEELRSGDKADGRNEADEAQVLEHAKTFHQRLVVAEKMAEYQSDDQDAGCSQLYALDRDASHQVADESHQEKNHQRLAHYALLKPVN